MKRSIFKVLVLVLVVTMLASCAKTTTIAQVPATITETTQLVDALVAVGPDTANVAEFDEPKTVAVDTDGNFYVYDGKVRIQKFDLSGKLLGEVGAMGTEDGQYTNVKVLQVGPDNSLYVGDKGSAHIAVFNSKGKFVKNIGARGDGDGQFKDIQGIAFNSKGEMIVGCGEMAIVQIFDADGNFVSKFGTAGEEEGQFVEADSVAVDSLDRIYVTDGERGKILLFAADGTFIREIGEEGEEADQFPGDIESIAVDAFDRLYVVDQDGGTVKVFDQDGNFITAISAAEGFSGPQAMTIDLVHGYLIVGEEDTNHVSVFDMAEFK